MKVTGAGGAEVRDVPVGVAVRDVVGIDAGSRTDGCGRGLTVHKRSVGGGASPDDRPRIRSTTLWAAAAGLVTVSTAAARHAVARTMTRREITAREKTMRLYPTAAMIRSERLPPTGLRSQETPVRAADSPQAFADVGREATLSAPTTPALETALTTLFFAVFFAADLAAAPAPSFRTFLATEATAATARTASADSEPVPPETGISGRASSLDLRASGDFRPPSGGDTDPVPNIPDMAVSVPSRYVRTVSASPGYRSTVR